MTESFWMYFFGFLGIAGVALIQAAGVILLALIKKGQTDAAIQVNHAAVKVTEVADQVTNTATALVINDKERVEKTDKIASDVADTKSWVNHLMEIQLRVNAKSTRKTANLSKDPNDRREADQAEIMLTEHVAKQAKIDDQKKKDSLP